MAAAVLRVCFVLEGGFDMLADPDGPPIPVGAHRETDLTGFMPFAIRAQEIVDDILRRRRGGRAGRTLKGKAGSEGSRDLSRAAMSER